MRSDDAVLLGGVCQEILSGITNRERYLALRNPLRTFADEPVMPSDYERGAEMYNRCRSSGVQASFVDVLISAVSERLGAPVLTLDGDFQRYREVLGIELA